MLWGHEYSWARERGVDVDKLPTFVAEFQREQCDTRREDAEKHPDILERLRTEGADRPEVTLQSLMNMRREMEILDTMCVAVRGLAEVGAYEHDCLCLYNPHLASDDERMREEERYGAHRCWRESVVAVRLPWT